MALGTISTLNSFPRSFVFLYNPPFWIKCQWYMLYLPYHDVICSTSARVSYLPEYEGLFPYLLLSLWGQFFRMSCPNCFPSPSSSKESYNCMDLKHVMLSAKMLSLPFMCLGATWLMLAISIPQLFSFELHVCAVRNLYNGAWPYFMVTFAS